MTWTLVFALTSLPVYITGMYHDLQLRYEEGYLWAYYHKIAGVVFLGDCMCCHRRLNE